MPIKYVGRTTDFAGKSLWEILGNLKNHGVGRMVIRNRMQRYPEPCYMRILKVAAEPNTSKNPHDARKVIALVEKTFRGVTHEKPVQIDSSSYKADYVLIPKEQEHLYLERTEKIAARVLPDTLEWPPLLKEYFLRQAIRAGNPSPELPKLIARYQKNHQYKRAANEDEATVKTSVDLCPDLYCSDVKSKASKTSETSP